MAKRVVVDTVDGVDRVDVMSWSELSVSSKPPRTTGAG